MAIDEQAFDYARRKIKGLDYYVLRKAIYGVYRRWFEDLKHMPRNEIDFHGYYALSLADFGITNEDEAEPYRKALGAFFNQRALKALRRRRRMPKNPVEDANEQEVLIRVIPEISVRFRALRRSGRVYGNEIIPIRKKIHYGSGTFTAKQISAEVRRRVVAVLNDKRGFKTRRKRN